MEKIDFKRKVESKILEWNNDPNKVPLIIDGLRQVGKSYIVNKFAYEHYENVITYDFRHNKVLRNIFDGNLDVDSIIMKSAPYFPDKNFLPYKTILVFEEIGDCSLARTSLKSFALDGRYSVICTGSLLGILNYKRKQKIDIPTGYEKIIQMTSMDFEEFLWANGITDDKTKILKDSIANCQEVPSAITTFYKEMIKRYVVIGGMPESVKNFLKTNNYIKSREYLEGLINDYRADFGRFVNDNNEEDVDYRLQASLNKIFDSIPSQLAKESDTTKFKYSEIKKGGRSSEFEGPFDWLKKAGLVLTCYNVRSIEKPLEANADNTYFKAFISDIGLLMAMYPLSVSQDFLSDRLESRKGAIYENLIATMINDAGLPLYYFSNGTDHLEVDFLIDGYEGLVLVEGKAVNGKMAASRAIMEGKTSYKATKCYKIIKENFGMGTFYYSVPQYAASFLFENIKMKINKGWELKPLKYPSLN